MPVYCYECKACGYKYDKFRPMSESGVINPCPKCSGECVRDYVAEASPEGLRHGDSPDQYSEAAGIHPSQIAAAKAQFPHHDFTPDGRMIFHGQRHKDRCLRDIGFVEHDKPR